MPSVAYRRWNIIRSSILPSALGRWPNSAPPSGWRLRPEPTPTTGRELAYGFATHRHRHRAPSIFHVVPDTAFSCRRNAIGSFRTRCILIHRRANGGRQRADPFGLPSSHDPTPRPSRTAMSVNLAAWHPSTVSFCASDLLSWHALTSTVLDAGNTREPIH